MQISEANYKPAWDLLVSRYDNKRVLIYHHLRALFNLQPMSSNSSDELRSLLNGTQQALKAIESLDRPVKDWDDLIVFITADKLSRTIRDEWENHISSYSDMPKLSELDSFLINRLRMLDSVNATRTDFKVSSKAISAKPRSRCTSMSVRNTAPFKLKETGKCPLCKASHLLLFCPTFRQYSVKERRAYVAKESLCFNCLRRGHNRANCPSAHRCQLCQQNHHTMLHTVEIEEVAQPKESQQNITSHVGSTTALNRKAILATAWVNVAYSHGQPVRLRALVDQGSETSFISESACQRLPRRKITTVVTGIGAQSSLSRRGLVRFQLSSCVDPTFQLTVEAFVLRTLTTLLPTQPVTVQHWPTLQGVTLADPTFHETSPVDLILGVEIYAQIILPGIRQDHSRSVLAQSTRLGWIISGSCTENKLSSLHEGPSTISSNFSSFVQLEEQLRKFWEVEELPKQRVLTKDELQCEDYFVNTHYRNPDGRYVVRLPTNGPSIDLGESRTMAVQRLTQMERRFSTNPKLKEAYCQFMKEYLELQHMEPVPSRSTETTYYLPHHGVYKNHDPTGKLRVVFDGSQKSSNGLSLNECLHAGPKLQQDLWSIVTRWREHEIVFVCDIEKMFRQIWINDQDTNLQRIVWRNSSSEPIRDFMLKTVTYGTVPAPYLAIRTLQQLAKDERQLYPLACESLVRDCYVDDILTGANDLGSAIQLKDDLINLLKMGGFTLKKWASNSHQLLKEIPPDHREVKTILSLEDDACIKTLGILWNPTTDQFGFKVQLPPHPVNVTKRNLLSDVSKLFDPLGFLAPSIILAKVMFQKLWLTGLTWDEPLPQHLANEWRNFRDELSSLEKVRVPRWLKTNNSQAFFELHGFADASNKAYAAVVYARVFSSNESPVSVQIIAAKTKVAPLKTVSIPRLELCAAVLLTRLLNNLRPVFTTANITTFAWTDSSTVLAWIRGHPSRWNTYVANRVSEIQNSINISQWKYVPSESNPADCASRGLNPEQLPEFHLWWNGPSWLQQPSTQWPSGIHSTTRQDDLEERKTAASFHAKSIQKWSLIERYSTFTRLLRVVAYIRRFVFNCRQKPEHRLTTVLSTVELQEATDLCIYVVQHQHFYHDISHIAANKPLSQGSHTVRLHPFLDEKQLLRVGGRLKNALLTYNERFPIILPKKDHFTTLIIKHYHELTLHGGTQLTLSHIRRNYWILDGRNAVRHYIHQCIPCFRQKAVMKDQLMSNLPPNRVRPSQPFQHTGVDYAGPIVLKIHKGRGFKTQKGYIAVFVCLCIKAVHLEVVGDMTTDSFIAAFRRFTSRRGICTDLYSDRATNFVGADAELRSKLVLSRNCQSYRVPELLSKDGTNWHFIPPHSPHFGGIWEAAVKSVKHHLKRVLGETLLTFEEMTTLLCQVEAALNSRPICPLNDDPDDLTPLSPGHFLIGGPLTSVPEPGLLSLKDNRLSRWQLTHKMFQDFWKRWSAEYLNGLQQRYKWIREKTTVKINDLVLLKDDRYPPCKWPIGRVTAVHPGPDGLVRVATVRTQHSVFLRPVVKLAVLPLGSEEVSDMYSNCSSLLQEPAVKTLEDGGRPAFTDGGPSSLDGRGGRYVEASVR